MQKMTRGEHLAHSISFALSRAILAGWKRQGETVRPGCSQRRDQNRQALLEICCAVVLGTPYNDFDTH